VTEIMSLSESGQWLTDRLADVERGESSWLEVLAEFDLGKGWALDGQLSGVDWLTWKGRMGRATAYEKLMVAHQLRQRPILKEAFHTGRISYSAVRVLARLDGLDPEVETALVELAEVGSVRDLERMAQVYRRHADQHRALSDALARRGVRHRPNLDGTTTVEITLTDFEAEEFMACVRAFIDQQLDTDDSARAESQSVSVDGGDDSARAETEPDDHIPGERLVWAARQADAVMELVRTALAHAREGRTAGDDRYMLHMIQFADQMQTLDGTPIDPNIAEMISCDTSRVVHLLGPGWEPLALGRRTREWSTAQRRAIMIRDGGQCRIPGCNRRHCDVHHHHPWEHGGPTDVASAYLGCDRHHTLIHSGAIKVTGDPNGELHFYRADGTYIGTTRPRNPTRQLTRLRA
jgi:hypothetical protein